MRSHELESDARFCCKSPPPPPPTQISSHPARYTFLSLNARSLFNKIEELSEVTEKLKPLFICVQETWCVHGEPDSFYHIDGFGLFRRDRVDRIGGGVCTYVNTSQANTIEQMQLDNDIEAIWLKITAENIPKPMIVASIYRPPTNPIDPFLSSLDRCLRRTNQLHDLYTLLAGDFNARNSCWYVEDTTVR